jgi:hypothetical protein
MASAASRGVAFVGLVGLWVVACCQPCRLLGALTSPQWSIGSDERETFEAARVIQHFVVDSRDSSPSGGGRGQEPEMRALTARSFHANRSPTRIAIGVRVRS